MSEQTVTDDVFLTVRITPDLRDSLKLLAEENDRTVAAEIRRALRHYVDTNVATIDKIRDRQEEK